MNFPKEIGYKDFVSITTTMFESNPNVMVHTNYGLVRSIDGLKRIYTSGNITIESIEVYKPQFSIGDTVMIVDTRDIGEIIMGPDNQGLYGINDREDRVWFSHSDQLVKIPTEFISLLQDNE